MNAARLHQSPHLSLTGGQEIWELLRSCPVSLAEAGVLAGGNQAHPVSEWGNLTASRGNLTPSRGNLTEPVRKFV